PLLFWGEERNDGVHTYIVVIYIFSVKHILYINCGKLFGLPSGWKLLLYEDGVYYVRQIEIHNLTRRRMSKKIGLEIVNSKKNTLYIEAALRVWLREITLFFHTNVLSNYSPTAPHKNATVLRTLQLRLPFIPRTVLPRLLLLLEK